MSVKRARGSNIPLARYGPTLSDYKQMGGPSEILSFTDPAFDALTLIQKPPSAVFYNNQDFPSFRDISQGETPTGNIPREELPDEENNIYTHSDPKVNLERFLPASDGRELAVNLTKMFVFAKKQEKLLFTKGIQTNQICTCMDPVTLNCHFALNHDLYAGKYVQELFLIFGADGVVQSDNGEARSYVSNAKSHRLIAVMKFGMTMIHNQWGSVRVGDRLGYILKPREPDEWVYTLSANKNRMETVRYDKKKYPHFCPWTFTPYKGTEDPLPSDLEYFDVTTKKICYGAFVFVGFCASDKYENSAFASIYGQPHFMYDVSAMITLPSVKIYTRPDVVFMD